MTDPGQRPTVEVRPRDAAVGLLLTLSIIGGWLTVSINWGWSVGLVLLCASCYLTGIILLMALP